MPVYEYRCKDCLTSFAVEAKMSDPAPTAGPGCSLQNCTIEKKMSRVMGWVKGKPSLPDFSKARAEIPVPPADSNETVHLCSKYCDHHAKA